MHDNEVKIFIKDKMPGAIVKKIIQYKDGYICQIFFNDPFEGKMDPFYYVNINKKIIKGVDFNKVSIKEIMNLFLE